MKKLLLLVSLTAGLMLPAATAQAATTIEKNIPFEATIDACGETITLSGTVVAVLTEQPLAGGGFLVTVHFQPQGITGTSTSGVVYHATGLTRDTTVQVPSGGLTDTFINRFHIVATAGGPTFYVKETVHFTVSPTGEIRASVEFASEECL
jgi:opacity protein-like surface antigen